MANLADLVFSWLWRVEKNSRAISLQTLMEQEHLPLDAGLVLSDLVAQAGGDAESWRCGVLQSFVDHAYHELKDLYGPQFVSRSRSILIDPSAPSRKTPSLSAAGPDASPVLRRARDNGRPSRRG